MGVIVVVFVFLSILLFASHFAFNMNGETSKAIILGVASIVSFVITFILIYFFIDFA